MKTSTRCGVFSAGFQTKQRIIPLITVAGPCPWEPWAAPEGVVGRWGLRGGQTDSRLDAPDSLSPRSDIEAAVLSVNLDRPPPVGALWSLYTVSEIGSATVVLLACCSIIIEQQQITRADWLYHTQDLTCNKLDFLQICSFRQKEKFNQSWYSTTWFL